MFALLFTLLATLPPCTLFDSKAPLYYVDDAKTKLGPLPLVPGIHTFQVHSSEWVDWCHVPYGAKTVTLDVAASETKFCKGLTKVTFWGSTYQDPIQGYTWKPRPEEPNLKFKKSGMIGRLLKLRRDMDQKLPVELGIEWMYNDLSVLIENECNYPVHLTIKLVSYK